MSGERRLGHVSGEVRDYTPDMQASRLLAALSVVAVFASVCSSASGLPSAFGQGAPPSAQSQAPGAPQVGVTPATVDFGKIKPESVTPAKFQVTNAGNAPLKIVKATPSCKCTAISPVEGTIIEPGQTIEISASLKAPSTPGERDAKVFLMFEGYQAPVILKLVGEVVMDIVCEPAFVDALKGVTSGVVKVRSQDGKPFRILSAGGSAPVYQGFDPATDQPKAAYDLKWNVAGMEKLPLWWVVVTDRPEARLLPLRVRNENTGAKADMGRFDRQWFVKESIVFIGSLDVAKPVEHTIEVEYYNPPSKDPTKARTKLPNWAALKSVRSADPSLAIEVLESKVVGDTILEVKVRVTGSTAKTIYTDCIIQTETGVAMVPMVAVVN